MDAQKFSKKSGHQNGSPKAFQKKNVSHVSQNGSPKTFQKEVIPKMEAQKLSKKKREPKWKPKAFPRRAVTKMETNFFEKKNEISIYRFCPELVSKHSVYNETVWERSGEESANHGKRETGAPTESNNGKLLGVKPHF